MKFDTKKFLKHGLAILIFLLFYTSVIAPASSGEFNFEKYKESKIIEYQTAKETEKIIDKKLLIAVNNYIYKCSNGKSQLNAKLIVSKCYENDIDLKLVLAQAQIESHFGTRGRAAKSHSVFNVGALDNGITLNFYEHPNHSIDPYIKLLKTKYLVNKTEKDLLYGKFVDNTGKRYATAKNYEKKLLQIISSIQSNTNIDKLLLEKKQIKAKIYQIEHNNFDKQLITL